ncbi:MAG: EAL domain-containing protein [Proteobacteria bacterium]|nr:EAL domain-containing protein [Pseudomonadota bacterium]
MQRRIHLKADRAQQKLNLIWLVFILFTTIFTLYYGWHQYQTNQQQQIQAKAIKIQLALEKLIEPLFLSSFFPKITHIDNVICDRDILPILHHINFNNLLISGLALIDKKGKICSTLNSEYSIVMAPTKEVSLQGPYKIQGNIEPIFVIIEPGKDLNFIIYILQSVIKNELTPLLNQHNFIALYNNSTKKYLLELGQMNLKPIQKNDAHFISVEQNLKSIPNLKIIIKKNISWGSFFYEKLPLFSGLILLGIFLYFQLKGLLNNYYSLDKAILLALKKKAFLPVYQPIYDVKQKKFTGAEVLVRWQVSSTDIIMPDEFIDEAERNGLIIPITLQLMHKVFQEISPFLSKQPNFYISFNVSARHFANNAFFERFDELCDFYHILPHQIMLELTERELLNQNDQQVLQRMENLRKRGFLLAVDDFGTGHASIQYLQHFPFNYLKIDKIFIRAIGTGAITETLNDAIIHMAKKINLKIIAEGVELKEQLQFLEAKEVDFIQGFYFAIPLPYSGLTKFLLENQKND